MGAGSPAAPGPSPADGAAGAPSPGLRGPDGPHRAPLGPGALSPLSPGRAAAPGPCVQPGPDERETGAGRGGGGGGQVGRVACPGARRLPVCESPGLAREAAAGGRGCPVRVGTPCGGPSLPGCSAAAIDRGPGATGLRPASRTAAACTSAERRARAVLPRGRPAGSGRGLAPARGTSSVPSNRAVLGTPGAVVSTAGAAAAAAPLLSSPPSPETGGRGPIPRARAGRAGGSGRGEASVPRRGSGLPAAPSPAAPVGSRGAVSAQPRGPRPAPRVPARLGASSPRG